MSDLDYENLSPEDAMRESSLVEYCPRCECLYTANGGYIDTVYDRWGNRYSGYLETSPDDGPFWCKECWYEVRDEVLSAVKGATNQRLSDYEE